MSDMDVDDTGDKQSTAELKEEVGLLSLPGEVVEQVFRPLSMTDRLSFARVSYILEPY
jgi:hypothetical protein